MPNISERLRSTIRHVYDFPLEGLRFLDVTPVTADADVFAEVIESLTVPFVGRGITHVLGLEARGFYFAGAVASRLRAGFVPVRKPGKLPPERLKAKGIIHDREGVVDVGHLTKSGFNTYHKSYEFEIADGVLSPNARVLIIDDLLAKGGSINACRSLVAHTGAEVTAAGVVIELTTLLGRANLAGLEVISLVKY